MADLGAATGITLVYSSLMARIQFQMQAPTHGLVIARAYMVQGSCCPGCFLPCSGPVCPHCRSDTCQFRLPGFPNLFSQDIVKEIFHRYQSSSMQALQFVGPFTIHFRVLAFLGSGVTEGLATEGRRV